MATISRIIALPSATDYFPIPPVLSNLVYGPVNFGGTPSMRIEGTAPAGTWKNKNIFSLYKYVVRRVSDDIVIKDDLINNFVGFSDSAWMPAGTACYFNLYTYSNGSNSFSETGYFTAQTKPDSPTSITLVSANSSEISFSWTDLSSASKWGGAPSADREWEFFIEKWTGPSTGYGQVVVSGTLGYAATSYTFGGSFDGQYRVTLYSRTKSGRSASFASTGAIYISAPASGNRCTSFDYFNGFCFTVNCCGFGLSGSTCSPITC